ncbi:MFS transporter [Streptomyces lasalocidi]
MRHTTAIAGGLAASAVGSLLLTGVHGALTLPLLMTGIAVLALGTGPLFALGTGLVLGSVPPERAGSAASMSETGNYFGGSLGFALLGVLADVVYRDRTHGTSDSLVGAVAASRRLPAEPGSGTAAHRAGGVHREPAHRRCRRRRRLRRPRPTDPHPAPGIQPRPDDDFPRAGAGRPVNYLRLVEQFRLINLS